MTRMLATGNPMHIVNPKGPKMMRILLECNYDYTKLSRLHLFLLERSSNTLQLKLQYILSVFIHLKTFGRARTAHVKTTFSFWLSFVDE